MFLYLQVFVTIVATTKPVFNFQPGHISNASRVLKRCSNESLSCENVLKSTAKGASLTSPLSISGNAFQDRFEF